ncbi:phosphotransferase [Acuticoccus sp. MNP-M23]|uniref:phosphotransferase enzyme family protein n=1 Tax=Acuticoccus sp. MNP-M23 TaxID=3072793 RepID=UPI002814C68B|nr:phosphotransferase [Acuticoccus sp. MNP-M23]WMS42356.1 phosphotransferase [Acuticoccus sp. MNP-M23]
MAGLYEDKFIEELRRGAQSLVSEWGLSEHADVSLLTVSENATFRADAAGQAPVILRVHRPGYHTRREIESELAWIEALRADRVVDIPAPLVCRSGGHIAGFDADGAGRDVVAFAFMPGVEPAHGEGLVAGFRQLGAINARLHGHARSWQAPEWFERKVWNFDTTVGALPHWGDWRAAIGLTAEGRALLEETTTVLRDVLAEYGTGRDRFGLIHADLRLANLLVDETGHIGVIDFDDCGFGWFMYDFAAAVSFFEEDPALPAWQAAWLEGYRTVAPVNAAEEAMLPTFVMLRRLLLTAWLASHAETPTAQELGVGYTDGTLRLAKAYLAR